MTKSVPRTAVALFVRQPLSGRVKTRLANDLGDQPACDLYVAMVTDILAQITASGHPLFLFHDGVDSVCLPPEWIAASERVVRQTGDTLGERMTAAFEQLFAAGMDRVIVVGSDIPGINTQILCEAFATLESHDLVIVPAFDGGYCLIAFRGERFVPVILQDMPWSTSRVLSATLEACATHRISCKLLDQLQDIDTQDDLTAYCRQPPLHAAATNSWLVRNGFTCPTTDSSPDR